MPEIEYPARPKFYANKVTRLLFKTAAANDLGSDVCYLVTQIAHQEDASRYAGPVTFWNEQLMAICGFKNVRALDRARAAAVKAGWLTYMHGGKGKVGKYFTLIPPKYVTYEDGAIDETNIQAELTPETVVTTEVARETPDNRQDNARETPENSQTNARETPEKCLTFLPSPFPEPIPNPEYIPPNPQTKIVQSCPPDESVTGIEIDGELITYDQDHIRWVPEFIRRWNSLPGVRRHDGNALSTPNLRALRERLTEHDWFWKRAFTKFPLHLPDGVWQITLGTFLQPATVSNILDGKYERRTTEAGLFTGSQKQEPGRIRTGATSDAIEQAMAEAAAKRGRPGGS